MLTVDQPTIFSRNLVVYRGDSPVGEIRHRAFRGGATVDVGGREYTVSRTGWFSGAYQLTHDERVLATASPAGFWSRRFDIEADSLHVSLRRQFGWFVTRWELVDGDQAIGSVERRGFFQSATVADFPDAIAIEIQVFIIWLANVLWQHDQSASAG